MKFIAHRGNMYGPNPEQENRPHYIVSVLNKGFDCEIDVRYIDGKWFLGHDTPDYEISLDFLLDNSDKLWIHCKNVAALSKLLGITETSEYRRSDDVFSGNGEAIGGKYPKLNIFWHQEEDFTLTSKGYIWTYPGKEITSSSIVVMPEWKMEELPKHAFAVCSDYFDYITHRNVMENK
jgi:hypothetical protein